jgi:hypothetical protein
MISDEEIEKAVDYLRDNAGKAAMARAERLYLEEFAKSLKAILMKEFTGETSVAAQEREALASLKYLQHLEAVREAVEIDEKHRFLRAAAEAKINAWQTFSANLRGINL